MICLFEQESEFAQELLPIPRITVALESRHDRFQVLAYGLDVAKLALDGVATLQ